MKLILHIGAPKCGSSSIQAFFEAHKQACREHIHYWSPSQSSIDQWETEGQIHTSNFPATDNDVLLCSHEHFFRRPTALRVYYDAIQNNQQIEETNIVCYVRRQADFLSSAYGQWGFRGEWMPIKAQQAATTLGYDATFFKGAESHLLAFIATDPEDIREGKIYAAFHWKRMLDAIGSRFEAREATLKIGLLPNKDYHFNLIEDFCTKAGLHILPAYEAKTAIRSNTRFDNDLIEGMNNALRLGYKTPNTLEGNDLLIQLSQQLAARATDTKFEEQLKQYIDSWYWEDNQAFCEQYKLDVNYFKPERFWTRSEILEVIRQEVEGRTARPELIIEEYRQISAKLADLSWRLMKEQSINKKPTVSVLQKLKAKFTK